MIKTVIQKIILNNFGKFIKGIQRDKLSVDLFGGNFKLQNISLNHEYFDSLNTPFKLAYSSIGKLNLTVIVFVIFVQAHLSKLSSVPVQCVLDNIYVIFQFRPQVTKQTKKQIFQNQKVTIKKYVDQAFKNFLNKIKEEKKQDGMMAKLGKKIVDNLQMKIVNVHVRFEQNRGEKYGWGLTLQQISLITANQKWEPTFIDRQKQSASNQKLYKKMNVKNLSLYWQTPKNQKQAKQILIKQYANDNSKRLKLLSMIENNKENSIISITSQFKLIMNNPLNQKLPLYQLDISLQPIKFELDRIQVIQMIDFTQKNVVQNQMILRTIKHKKKQNLGSEEELNKLKEQFRDYVDIIVSSSQNQQKNSDIEVFQLQKKQSLERIFRYIQIDQLMEMSIGPIKKTIKKLRQQEIKKKKRGWFGSADTQLDQKQLEELEKFVQTTLDQNQGKKRSQSAQFFCITSDIAGGHFQFVDRKSNPQQNQSIQFEIGQISFAISKTSDQSQMQITFSVQQIALSLVLPQMIDHKYKRNKLQILRNQRRANKTEIQGTLHERFIQLVYKKQSFLPDSQSQSDPKIVTSMSVQMQRIIFIYKKIYFKKFKQFFTFKNFNEYMKSTTMQKIQNLKQKEKNIIEESKVELEKIQNVFVIKISAISPKIICPFNEKQCWCLSLGDLKVSSQNNQEKSVYPLKITSAYLRYYNNIEICLSSIQSQTEISSQDSLSFQQTGIFSVLNDMNFDVLYESNKKLKTSSTTIQLPQFQLNFSRTQYQNLLTIKNIFDLDLDEKQTILQHLKKSRLQIQQQKIYQNSIKVKDEDLGIWQSYHGILAGDLIYLYQNKKELKQIKKISVKNCSTILINAGESLLRTTSNKELSKQYQMQLISSQEYCHLACQTEQELQKWQEQIIKKANQFKTINQLMEFYEQSDQKSENSLKHSRKRSSNQILYKPMKKNSLEVKIAKIGFKYQDYEKNISKNDIQNAFEQRLITLMNFQVHKVQFARIEEQKFTSFTLSLSEMAIVDEIFHYKNEKFQTFLLMKNFALKHEKHKKQKKTSQLASQKAPQKKYPIKNYITVEDLKINWKPDVILIILDLMRQHLSKEQKYRMDDELNKTRNDHFDQIFNDAKYMFVTNEYTKKAEGKTVKHKRNTLSRVNKYIKQLLTIDIRINHGQAFFIHRQSHLVMFRVQSNQILAQYVLGQHQKFISGSLGTITLEQMTNYPKKTYSSDDQMTPFCLAKKKQTMQSDQKDKPIISFYYSNYQPSVLPNQQRIDSFIYIEVEPVEVVYFQQVIFRLIDYSLIQIMLLINQPQMLTVNQNLMSQLNRKQETKQKPIKLLFSAYEEIIKKLVSPYFMDMYFEIKHPQIIMKAEKSSSHFYKINFDSIKIQNKNIQTTRRFEQCKFAEANHFIYEQEYSIKCDHLLFEVVDEVEGRVGSSRKIRQKQYIFFNPVQFSLNFNKLLLEDELNLIYPELGSIPDYEYDRSFIIDSKMGDIVVPSCSRFEYLSLNKLVNFNLTYDDQCDEVFIHNFKVTKLLLPKPIIYSLRVDKILFNADNRTEQENSQIKLFTADIKQFRFQYLRKKDLNSEMNIQFGDTKIIGYRYEEQKLSNHGHHSHSHPHKQKQYVMHSQQLILLKSKNHVQSTVSSQIVIQSKITGQKVIQMTVKSMNVIIKTGLLQLIFQYTLLEDWIFPIINKVVPQMTFFATIQDMDAVIEDDPQLLNKVRSQNIIKQIISEENNVTKSGMHNIRILKLCGIMCYKFHRKKTYSQQYFKQMLEKGSMTVQDIQKLPDQTYMNIVVNTQLYHCYKNTDKKRRIMQKFTLNMNQKRFLKLGSTETITFKNTINRTFNIDKCFFKVSVIDLLLMKDFLEVMGIQRKYIDWVNKEIGKPNQQQFALNTKHKQPNDELSTLDSMNVNVTSLSFYLINSWKQKFIPIINFKIEELNLTSNNTFKKDIIQGDFHMMLNYFNSVIFKWQPAIQRVGFSFFKQSNKVQNSKVFAGIESSSSLNLNISKQMFVAMRETIAAWNTQSEIFNCRLISNSTSNNEPIQFISHYIIRNQIGYPIQIFCQNVLKYKLKHLQQVDHEMEMENFQEEVQRDVIIAFNIVHPVHKFKKIGNVSVNAEKQYIIKPILLDENTLDGQSKIKIKPITQSSKQVLVIGSTKKVKQYFDNQCRTTILTFDSPSQIKLNSNEYGQKSANLYKTKQTKAHKFIGENGILTIMPKYLVFNYTPITLKIDQKIVKPNQYVGVFNKPQINGKKIKQSMLRVQFNQKEGHFYIYCEAYIVDYYGLYFDFGNSSQGALIKKLYSAEGQKNGYTYFIYVLPQAEFKFKVKISEKQKQNQTLRTDIGQLSFDLAKGSALCSFSAFCYLSPYKNQHLKQFNRVIEITPAYVLSNTTKDTLKICQKDSLSSMTLKPHERCPFFWEDIEKPKQIKIAAFGGQQLWGYSGALLISKSCQTFVLRKNSDPSQYRIFSIHIQRTNTITFVHIFQAPSKYKIGNEIKGVQLTVFQTCLQQMQAQNQFMSPHQFVFNVRYSEQKDFGYQLPVQNHQLTIEVELDNNMPQFKDLIAKSIVIQDIQSSLYVKKIPLFNQVTKKRQGHLLLVLQFQGNVKKLKLVEQQKQINNQLSYQYSIKLMSFGISLIGTHDQYRREIIFCLLEGIDLQWNGNQDIEGYELVIQSIRIENQLKYNAAFPTILQSYKTKKANFFVQFALNRDAKNSKFIRSIGLAINRTIITITSEQLQALQQNLTEILSIKINQEKEKQNQLIREYQLFQKSVLNVEQSYYFEEAEIQPLKLILTFKHVNNWGGRLLKAFSSMNQSMISVDGKKIMHFNAQNISSFMKSVQESYKDQIFKNILPLIGNLSILGSPVSLVQKIGSGFKDLIQLPAQEFQNGPLGIGKGIAKGTRSLVKNTFQGAMNTVQSFTGSLGNGLTALVDDQQFEKKREKIKNQRTQHVGEGLKNGAKSIFNGFSKGITGLITQPVKGAQKDGLSGFLIGGLKGITGLVIKPVSGIIDATTKTAEGIKNTANFLSPSQRQKRLKRVHDPRPFYSHCRQFRTYDPYLAQILKFLQEYGDIKIPLGWVGYFSLKSSEKKKPILLLTYEHMIFLDLKRKQIVKCYYSEDLIEAAKQDNNKFKITIKDRKMQNKQGHITLETENSNLRAVNEINKLIKFYRPKFTFE